MRHESIANPIYNMKCVSIGYKQAKHKQVVKRNMRLLLILLTSYLPSISMLKCYTCDQNAGMVDEYQALFQFCHPSDITMGYPIDCPLGSCFKSNMTNKGTVFISRACVGPKKPDGCELVLNIFVISVTTIQPKTDFFTERKIYCLLLQQPRRRSRSL